MKKLVMVLSGLLFWATPGWAQADYPKVEVYGGFAYARQVNAPPGSDTRPARKPHY